ncbi:hypothetical protein HOY82DRAFT_536699 [Tuber indicum]|nr:hypothetical protein HOY82DRAFT_536699 [Tuber indicum]
MFRLLIKQKFKPTGFSQKHLLPVLKNRNFSTNQWPSTISNDNFPQGTHSANLAGGTLHFTICFQSGSTSLIPTWKHFRQQKTRMIHNGRVDWRSDLEWNNSKEKWELEHEKEVEEGRKEYEKQSFKDMVILFIPIGCSVLVSIYHYAIHLRDRKITPKQLQVVVEGTPCSCCEGLKFGNIND